MDQIDHRVVRSNRNQHLSEWLLLLDLTRYESILGDMPVPKRLTDSGVVYFLQTIIQVLDEESKDVENSPWCSSSAVIN